MTIRRRDFLKAMQTAAAAAAFSPLLTSCRGPDRPRSRVATAVPPPRGAPESWVVSTCGACPGGCGIRARLVSGRLVGIAGNPLHPVNRGGLCPLGISGVHAVYHPDRVRGPLRRTGAGGSGEQRPTSWDEAVSTLTARLRDLRQRGLSRTGVL